MTVRPVSRHAIKEDMIELRPNQTEPVRKAIEFFEQDKPKPSLIVLPTAWGKSILTAFVAKACQDPIIVLQPSKELLEQNYLKYCTLCDGIGAQAGIYSASFGRKEIMPVTYATIGSIKNLGAKFKELGFTKMLIDEAHLYPREADSMLGRFLSDSGITHVLGITATPVKLQTNFISKGGGHVFKTCYADITKQERQLLQRHYPCRSGQRNGINGLLVKTPVSDIRF